VTLADVLVHEAGHAVAAWELGVRIGAIHVHLRVREGRMTFASDVGLGRFPAGSDALRLAIDREMVVLHAGLVAQKRFHYEGACGLVPRTDYEGILATALQVETDLRLIDEWSDYAEERARALIELPQTWRRVEALAVDSRDGRCSTGRRSTPSSQACVCRGRQTRGLRTTGARRRSATACRTTQRTEPSSGRSRRHGGHDDGAVHRRLRAGRREDHRVHRGVARDVRRGRDD
jgi:hypothetical protein